MKKRNLKKRKRKKERRHRGACALAKSAPAGKFPIISLSSLSKHSISVVLPPGEPCSQRWRCHGELLWGSMSEMDIVMVLEKRDPSGQAQTSFTFSPNNTHSHHGRPSSSPGARKRPSRIAPSSSMHRHSSTHVIVSLCHSLWPPFPGTRHMPCLLVPCRHRPAHAHPAHTL